MTMSWTGLAAETWDCLGGDEPQSDYEFIRALVEGQQGTALDVGCGTGRLLIRLLRDGLVVHGIDNSQDMLAICRAKARSQGLEPELFHQAMETLALPHRYATIFVACGSFMLHLDDRSAVTALRRFREHLAPDGVVLLTFFGPSAPPDPTIGRWTRKATGRMPDGAQATMDVITDRHDPDTQVVEGRRKYVIAGHGTPTREEILDDRYRWYSVEHAARLVGRAGFRTWTATGDYSEQEVADGHSVLVLSARE
ncbi:MAG: class I SAM-dependent methyltransferase [Planctomycetota bacterium]|jgi:SAM-dependent methyltransferase